MVFKLGSTLKAAISNTDKYLNTPLADGLTRADHLQNIGRTLATPEWRGAAHEAGDFLPPASLPPSRGGGVGGIGGGKRRRWQS
ncbi:hypothetical protein [Phenylobacterium sp. 58.2.17]|uniref:hypothetical protein n=1 Tax=Phenylobacterium sp. 58.2.17 TaxID=2969306 RepID=UPI002264A980|nr:hypothetical protein [Phenylobacterium sp. 58.2.17]MCX7587192.1 hypothetical protein [Phenylobacterium sp. 58.2.17]